MKCPHCEYAYGWDGDKTVDGLEGEFYELPVKVERRYVGYGQQTERKAIYACPACTKTFTGN